jgi:hypothetical protein
MTLSFPVSRESTADKLPVSDLIHRDSVMALKENLQLLYSVVDCIEFFHSFKIRQYI